mgnify:CR=1 FL=1
MISKEVEKLRGRLFTKEEMEDIIIPILMTSKEHLMKNECEPEEYKPALLIDGYKAKLNELNKGL